MDWIFAIIVNLAIFAVGVTVGVFGFSADFRIGSGAKYRQIIPEVAAGTFCVLLGAGMATYGGLNLLFLLLI